MLAVGVASKAMPALARHHVTHPFTRAANDDCINGGSCTRTKYSYDAAGHTSGYGSVAFTYNDRGRMEAANATDYLYNALGQMIEKSNSSGTMMFMQDESGHLLGEYNGSGSLVEETIWLGDIPVATLEPNGSGGVNIFYVHTDHLNAPRKVAQPTTGTLAWRWDTDPFGTAAPNQNPAGLGTFPYNLRFPGQYYQAETGLNQNVNRDYDPLIGRYAESDPEGLGGGSASTYSYVGADPVELFDPSGLFAIMYKNAWPVLPATEAQVLCMMNVLGTQLIITGGMEPGHAPAAKGGKHPLGQAVDFGANNNPTITPDQGMEGAVIQAACQCSFNHGGWEPNFIPGAAKHYHFQNGAGPSNVPKLNCDKTGCKKAS
jgi:RHS repeat-associated protein